MAEIFISYKREDRDRIEALARSFEAWGWDIWWHFELVPGDRFDGFIDEKLRQAKCVIVVWSRLSVDSKYVRDEARFALDRDRLIPIALEDAVLTFRFEGH